jgi:hypothetical protein
VIVSLNQLGYGQIASMIAYLYIFLYSTAILTITLWATLAIKTIYT